MGWDGSRYTHQAFRSAVHSAEELRAEVVIQAGPTRYSHAGTADQVVEDVAEPCREALAEMTAQARHEGSPATVRVRHEVIEADQTGFRRSTLMCASTASISSSAGGTKSMPRCAHVSAGRASTKSVTTVVR